MQVRKIPYFSQVMSPKLVHDFIYNRISPDIGRIDPRWAEFGSENIEDYARWWDHVCGIACLKMILAARGIEMTFWEILQGALAYGAYAQEEDGKIRGLIYRPCVEMLDKEFDIRAEVKEYYAAQEAMKNLADNPETFFIASVHPTIRHIEQIPPQKGGHLVLVHAFDSETETIIMHNPSGNTPATQKNANIPLANFKNFYAERGIVVF